MTQLEALKIAHEQLSNMMPYDGENDEIFEADEVIENMILAREKRIYINQLKNAPRSSEERRRRKEIHDMFADILDKL